MIRRKVTFFIKECAKDNNISCCNLAPLSSSQHQHHCRNCGQTFCNTCCSKKISLPDLGIEEEARVCDGCHDQKTNPLNKYGSSSPSAGYGSTPSSSSPYSSLPNNNLYGGSFGSSPTPTSSYGNGYSNDYGMPSSNSYSSPARASAPKQDDMDEDLKRALELSMKETRQTVSFSGSKSFVLFFGPSQ